jgi:hypothetical protein
MRGRFKIIKKKNKHYTAIVLSAVLLFLPEASQAVKRMD